MSDARLAALLEQPPDVAAPGVLGALLVREGVDGGAATRRVGRIVEVEAYAGPGDRASHARFGPTARTRTMFGAAGRAYVYGVYGMHTCLNVVTGPPGTAGAILVRAVEPLAGVDAMRAARVARGVATRRADARDPVAAAARLARVPGARLASGPANVAAAFDIWLSDDGLDLLDPSAELHLEIDDPLDGGRDAPRADEGGAEGGAGWSPAYREVAPGSPAIASGPRIGVAYAGPGWADRAWRFWLVGSPAVSGRR